MTMNIINAIVILVLFLTTLAAAEPVPAVSPSTPDPALTPEVLNRAIVSEGDLTRVWRVMFRAKRGEPITVATIGGSITQGSVAQRMQNRYPNVMAAWWQATFPNSKVTLVNAGIGATGSDFGSLRVASHVLSKHPDLVVVEFAVNDSNTRQRAETLEGVVRQILADPDAPAVVLLFMSDHGHNAQEQHSKVGEHYNLPMVSYRDALWPEIDAGQLSLDTITKDNLHPNDRGHVMTGQLLGHLFDVALSKLPASEPEKPSTELPAPLISDVFQHTWFVEGADLKPTAVSGWVYDPAANVKAWKTSTPGSTIEFDVPGGTRLYLNYFRVRGAMGKADVQVDDGPAKTIDAWFDQTWGSYRETTIIADGAPSQKHHLKITLSSEKNPQSTGYEFRITGLGASGI